ncbi:MAG TPA: lyase family protein, partial [Syntrophorhabdaceae bacterium]|nr:lyase family protein [Syntrophorhabdaceae bacterium]
MKLWGGRFKEKTDPLMERFSASINFDRVLYEEDIEGSIAHAEMLERIGILSKEEKESIIKGLGQIKKEIENNEFRFQLELEDIHMHIESRLIELIGETGRKLHTGRSRNDQVSLDMRMFLKKRLKEIEINLLELLKTIVKRAEDEKDTLMPGYTHMQR